MTEVVVRGTRSRIGRRSQRIVSGYALISRMRVHPVKNLAARNKCRKASVFFGATLFSSLIEAAVAVSPYGHKLGGEQTGYTTILAQLLCSNLGLSR